MSRIWLGILGFVIGVLLGLLLTYVVANADIYEKVDSLDSEYGLRGISTDELEGLMGCANLYDDMENDSTSVLTYRFGQEFVQFYFMRDSLIYWQFIVPLR
ncbi:MAG: hypothetical protein ABIB79_03845 [archaeon]